MADLSETVARLEAKKARAIEAMKNLSPFTLDAASEASQEYTAELKAAAPQLINAAKENAALKKLFEELTPGGSEFVGSPQNCALYVKHRMEGVMGVAKERNELRAENLALQAQLEGAERERDRLWPVVKQLQSWVNAKVNRDWATLRGLDPVEMDDIFEGEQEDLFAVLREFETPDTAPAEGPE